MGNSEHTLFLCGLTMYICTCILYSKDSISYILQNTPIPDQTTTEEFSLAQDSSAVREEIILQCCHPCITCMERYNSSSQGFTNDHSYFKTPNPNPTVLNEPPVFSNSVLNPTKERHK